MLSEQPTPSWLDRNALKEPFHLKIETLLAVLILAIALVSRFAMLDARVMSHDEVNHVVPSYDLFTGKGYAHSPVTHGPFQMHVVALSYFLFGDSDYTSRIPAALFSLAAVGFVLFAFRPYLGRTGALLAGLFFTISPYMLFYGRYTRNEGFIELFGVVMLFAVLRFMQKGDRLSLFLLTGSIVFHFIAKETAFIYSAQLLIFLAFLFLIEVRRAQNIRPARYNRFLILIGVAMLLVFTAIGFGVINARSSEGVTPAAAQPANAATVANAAGFSFGAQVAIEAFLVLGALALAVIAFIMIIRDLGWKQLCGLRSFSMLILSGTLILPQLAAFPVKMVGWNPLDYTGSGLMRTGIFLGLFLILSAAIGLLWNRRLWLQNAAFFYAVYVFFYTTMFTNGNGFFTGIIGSLGYWLEQQGVNRGSQPFYYYALVQIPIYEFLAAAGTTLAVYFGIRYRRWAAFPGDSPALPQPDEIPAPAAVEEPAGDETPPQWLKPDADVPAPQEGFSLDTFYALPRRIPTLALLVFWALTSLLAFSLAGEKMPWLTVHIALPMLLAAGWGVGYLIDTTEWKRIANGSAVIALLLLPVFFTSFSTALGIFLGDKPPFAGNTLEQLQSTSSFALALLAAGGSGAGILALLRKWQPAQVLRLATLTVLLMFSVLTARAAYRANFILYDTGMEFLVYAHGARGPKDILQQVEEISRRMTGGKDIVVAYSDDANYPNWWYLRDYPNKRWFGRTPTRDLRDAPLIIAGDDVLGKMDAIVGEDYVMYEYMRLVWPMQDYYNLTWERIRNALTDLSLRAGIFDIWLNRDYKKYAAATANERLIESNWSPGAKIRLYIRKDIVGKIWNFGAAPAAISQPKVDPYQAGLIELAPDKLIGAPGTEPGQLQSPRTLAVAKDGTLFVADTRNHRVQHFKTDGTLINTFGSFGDNSTGGAGAGLFNEIWGIAIGPDGNIYLSDTWNHRIQVFTPDGNFVRMWGTFGQGDKPDSFWGPRALAFDSKGRLYIADTGNKRIAVFNTDGTFVTQFGSAGMELGQFDEPTGLAIDSNDQIYVADTWNQRVQVFVADETGMFFTPVKAWDIAGWFGTSLDNKPNLAVSPVDQHLFVADPEGGRVLEFNPEGNYMRGWGRISTNPDGFGLVAGLAVDADGGVWVADGGNSILLHFNLPR